MSTPGNRLRDFLIKMQFLIAISKRCTFESGGIISKNEPPPVEVCQNEPIINKKAFKEWQFKNEKKYFNQRAGAKSKYNKMKAYLSIFLIILCSFNNAPLSKRGQILSKIQNKKVALFVNSSWDIAQFVQDVYGIPLELTLAQACQESGFGTSRKALQECNYFGIKGYKFASKEECFLKYADILTCLPCYQNLQPKTLEQWFDALDCCYYSGDKNYRNRLKKIIKKYLTI